MSITFGSLILMVFWIGCLVVNPNPLFVSLAAWCGCYAWMAHRVNTDKEI